MRRPDGLRTRGAARRAPPVGCREHGLMADDSTEDAAYGRSADAYDLIYDGIGKDDAAEAAEVTALIRRSRWVAVAPG